MGGYRLFLLFLLFNLISISFASTTCSGGFSRTGYDTSGAAICVSCASSQVASGTSSSCTSCSNPLYPDLSMATCSSCPAGYACAGYFIPTLCHPGTYSPASSDSCLLCEDGYSDWGASSCTACPEGSYCTADAAQTCPTDTFSASGSSICIACPGGHSCSGSTITACPIGQYSYPSDMTCSSCPYNSFCPVAATIVPLICPPGAYSLSGASSCTAVPGGYIRSTSGSGVTACNSGYFSSIGSTQCISCPIGHSCTLDGSSPPTKCPAGQKSDESVLTCSDCVSGEYCPNDSFVARLCEPGTYNPSAGQSVCQICPAGYACPEGSISPTGCADGTFAGEKSSECLECAAGWLCSNFSDSRAPETSRRCPRGFFCLSGAVEATACPAGTFGREEGLRASAECSACPAGYFCPEGTTDYLQYPCPPHHFCPGGVAGVTSDLSAAGIKASISNPDEYACPTGTFSFRSRITQSSDCYPCSAGFICPNAGSPPAICPSGFYCPQTSLPRSVGITCPPGTYSSLSGLSSATQCTVCPAGYFCTGDGSTSPSPCEPGTYNPLEQASTKDGCLTCPPGYPCSGFAATILPIDGSSEGVCQPGFYCPSGSVSSQMFPCPAGTYNSLSSSTSLSACLTCPVGFACPEGCTGVATDSRRPPVDCSVGFYCPEGSTATTEYPCPAGSIGTITNAESESDCSACPAGSYCTAGSSSATGLCSAGYYCPEGSSSPTEVACPAGTYSSTDGAAALSDCLDCPAGFFCPEATANPVTCPVGSAATSTNSESAGPGVFPACESCPANRSCPDGISIVACSDGYYNPDGQSTCYICPVGYWCSPTSEELSRQPRACAAGNLCDEEGIYEDPSVTLTRVCPIGQYCPEATAEAINCPAGTYGATTGLSSSSDCSTMTAGYYSTGGQSDPTPSDKMCATGHYCPAGSRFSEEESCPEGFYRDVEGAASAADCPTCPVGKYCPRQTTTPIDCTAGSFCPEGSSKPTFCPIGTYSSSLDLESVTDCTDCPAGKYCDESGSTAPTGDCSEGFICYGKATQKDPRDGVTGEYCPVGGYCPLGTTTVIACSLGTFNPIRGATDASGCIACDSGRYCVDAGDTTGDCYAGYFCTSGASSPTQEISPVGYYSLAGAAYPSPCLPGTYQSVAGQSSCLECPEGYYCPTLAVETPTDCPAGHFCVAGSIAPEPCAIGSYVSTANSFDSACEACPAGKYCLTAGLSSPTGDCYDGFFCRGSAVLAGAWGDQINSVQGVCLSGSYCLLGIEYSCPAGTYNPSSGGDSLDSCLPCPSGSYCPNTGMSATAGECSAGYYCPDGSTSATEVICPAGYACPVGSSAAIECDAGFYSTEGLSSCVTCPMGQYCEAGAAAGTACPAGYYCVMETKSATMKPCPRGTYNPSTGGSFVSSACLPCPAGQYCSEFGLSASSGDCIGGYYCSGGATSSSPATYGYRFESGIAFLTDSYCDSTIYTDQETVYDACATTYTSCIGVLVIETDVSVTYQLLCGSDSSTTTTDQSNAIIYRDVGGGQCEAGYYCPSGSSSPISCPAGKYCMSQGLSSPTGDCYAGYLCSGGQSSPNAAASRCAAGYYCLEGATSATPCPVGTFRTSDNGDSLASCYSCPVGYACETEALTTPSFACPAGYYCEGGVADHLLFPCTVGNYCPAGSTNPLPCSAGTYTDTTGATSCTTCPEGFYCTIGVSVPVACETGYYCPSGSTSGWDYPCAAGTYNPSTGTSASASCLSCPAGFSCPNKGRSETTTASSCREGYYCVAGSTTVQNQVCPIGYYCPAGSSSATVCPSGFYCPAKGLSQPSGRCHNGWICGSMSSTAQPSSTIASCSASDGGQFTGYSTCSEGYFCQNSAAIRTIAGSATTGYSGDGGLSTSAGLSSTVGGSCEDASGNLYIADTGNRRLRMVNSTTSYIDLVAGTGDSSVTASQVGSSLLTLTQFVNPVDVLCGVDGYIYVLDVLTASSTYSLIKIDIVLDSSSFVFSNLSGSPSSVCGVSASTSSSASASILGIQPLYFVDTTQNIILSSNSVSFPTPTTFAGTAGSAGTSADGTLALSSLLSSPTACALDLQSGDLYIADSGNYLVRKVSYADSLISSVVGNPSVLPSSSSISWEASGSSLNSFSFDASTSIIAIAIVRLSSSSSSLNIVIAANSQLLITTSSTIHVLAGSSTSDFKGDGNSADAANARFNTPKYLSPVSIQLSHLDTLVTSHIYTTDSLNHRVRRLALPPSLSPASTPTACPAGFFLPHSAGTSFLDCLACPPGMVCSTSGLSSPDDKCSDGYYCPLGSISNTEVICPAGYFCPAFSASRGAVGPVPCARGTYSSSTGATACTTCPAGTYCDASTDAALQSPTPCPAGFYCPVGTSNYFSYPCPIGTFSASTSQSTQSACTSCTPGMYCASRGLSSPSGDCTAGFYCATGAWLPAPTWDSFNPDLTTVTNTGAVCPEHYYCPTGSSSPTSCPAGTIAPFTGADDLTRCEPCPAGKYCPGLGVTLDCSAGYVCLKGASTATPTDSTTGYICPIANYCPTGSNSETPCPPGYTSSTGASECSVCSAGQFCEGRGTSLPSDCPAGSYCPEGSAAPIACEPGYVQSLTGQSDCSACPTGTYCPEFGMSDSSSYVCDGGYICSSGASISSPADGVYSLSDVPNGSCPVGYYCTAGASAPTPCPIGTYSNVNALSTCIFCPAGYYCETTALTGPTDECSPGYYCPSGSSSATESTCPAGYYCPAGTPTPLLCDSGLYAASAGMSECESCPEGFRCLGGGSAPEACPSGRLCPSGSSIGNFCPDGSVWDSTGDSINEASSCRPCSKGMYCRAGQELGTCAGGYLCGYGNQFTNPNPTYTTISPYYDLNEDPSTWVLLTDSNWDLLDSTVLYGAIQCPAGHYCPDGSTSPLVCPTGSVRLNKGGVFSTDCTNCPSGYYCPDGDLVPTVCPVAHYCPEGSKAPIECPLTTFSADQQNENLSDCTVCGAGYYCYDKPLSDPYQDQYLCPAGYYCTSGTTDPISCPPATYNPYKGAKVLSHCLSCPQGYYCATANLSLPSDTCPAGYYCPLGSSQPLACSAGTYCPQSGLSSSITCPAGFYCPGQDVSDTSASPWSSPGTISPVACSQGTYCPAGSSYPLSCPLGYYGTDSVGIRSTLSGSCTACPAGTYQPLDGQATCYACEAGYLCYEGCNKQYPTDVTTDKGEICPPGYYCPSGSPSAIACSAGYFSDISGKGDSSACNPCPAGSYGVDTGSTFCNLCGGSATSEAGSSDCTCLGENRVFQSADRACICPPGYEATATSSGSSSNLDGVEACQSIVYERCSKNYLMNYLGECVQSDTECDEQCNGSSGRLLSALGICECSGSTDAAIVCDLECQEAYPAFVSATGGLYSDGVLVISDSNLTSVASGSLRACSYDGSDSSQLTSSDASCQMKFIDMNEAGQSALFGAPSAVISYLSDVQANGVSSSRRRRLQSSDITISDPGITRPVQCLKVGDSVTWVIRTLTDGTVSYPVYLRDSLINTNPYFDYSAFRQLGDEVGAGVVNSFFVFSFIEEGTYAFVSSANSNALSVLNVVGMNKVCRDQSATPQALTSTSLTAAGIHLEDSLVYKINWILVVILVCCIIIVAILFFIGMFAFEKFKWTKQKGVDMNESLFEKEHLHQYKIINLSRSFWDLIRRLSSVPSAWLIKAQSSTLANGTDPRVFQALYSSLLSHHTDVARDFQILIEQRDSTVRALVRDTSDTLNRLLVALKDALNSRSETDAIASKEREIISSLLKEMDSKRSSLVEAWKTLQGDAQTIDKFWKEKEKEDELKRKLAEDMRKERQARRDRSDLVMAADPNQDKAITEKVITDVAGIVHSSQDARLALRAKQEVDNLLKDLAQNIQFASTQSERQTLLDDFKSQLELLDFNLDEARKDKLQLIDELVRGLGEEMKIASDKIIDAQDGAEKSIDKASADTRSSFVKFNEEVNSQDEQDALERAELELKHSNSLAEKIKNARDKFEQELGTCSSDEERRKILAKFADEALKVASLAEQQRLLAENELLAKQKARRDALRKKRTSQLDSCCEKEIEAANIALEELKKAEDSASFVKNDQLRRAIEAEANEDLKSIMHDAVLAQEVRRKIEHAKLEDEKLWTLAQLDPTVSDLERRKIIDEFDRKSARLDRRLTDEFDLERNNLEAKLNERNAKRLRRLQESDQVKQDLKDATINEVRQLEIQLASDGRKSVLEAEMAADVKCQDAEMKIRAETANAFSALNKEFAEQLCLAQSLSPRSAREKQEAALKKDFDEKRAALLRKEADKLSELHMDHLQRKTTELEELKSKLKAKATAALEAKRLNSAQSTLEASKRLEELEKEEKGDRVELSNEAMKAEFSALKGENDLRRLNDQGFNDAVLRDKMAQELSELNAALKNGFVDKDSFDEERRQLLEKYQKERQQMQSNLELSRDAEEKDILYKLDQRRNRKKTLPASKTVTFLPPGAQNGEDSLTVLANQVSDLIKASTNRISDELDGEVSAVADRAMNDLEFSRKRFIRSASLAGTLQSVTVTPEERQAVCLQWENERKRAQKLIESSHEEQEAIHEAKMLERRRKRVKKLEKENKQKLKVSFSQNAIADSDGNVLNPTDETEGKNIDMTGMSSERSVSSQSVSVFEVVRQAEADAERSKVQSEHRERLENMRKRHEEEKKRLRESLQEEDDILLQNVSPEADVNHAGLNNEAAVYSTAIKWLEDEKRSTQSFSSGDDEDARKALLSDFDEKIKILESQIAGENVDAQALLAAKLEARRVRIRSKQEKETQLLKRQAIEEAQEEAKVVDELEKAAAESYRRSENAAIDRSILENQEKMMALQHQHSRPKSISEYTREDVERILGPRHSVEIEALESRYKYKRKLANLQKTPDMQEVEDNYELDLKMLSLQHAKEIAEVLASSGKNLEVKAGASAVAKALTAAGGEWMNASNSSLSDSQSEGDSSEDRMAKLEELRNLWKKEEELARQELFMATERSKQKVEVDTADILLQEMEKKRNIILEKLRKKNERLTNNSNSENNLDKTQDTLEALLQSIDNDSELLKEAREVEKRRQQSEAAARLSAKKALQAEARKRQSHEAKKAFQEKLQKMTKAKNFMKNNEIQRNPSILNSELDSSFQDNSLNTTQDVSLKSSLKNTSTNGTRNLESLWGAILRREKSHLDANSSNINYESLTSSVLNLEKTLGEEGQNLVEILQELSDVSQLLNFLKSESNVLLEAL